MITSIGVPKSISLTKPPDVLFPTCGQDGVDCFFLLKRHVVRIAVGLVAFFLGFRIPVRFWRKIAIPLFGFTFLLLIFVLFAGSTVGTTARAWLIFANTSVQPAEFAKLALIFYLGTWMERKGKDIEDFRNGFLSFCVVTAIIVIPVILQPDFGSSVVFAAIATGIYFVAGARIRHLALGLTIIFFISVLIVPNVGYLKYRFASFVSPTVENCQPEPGKGEIRRNYCWQTEQANIAVGSGRIFGKGLTQGIQKAYWLPQATDDFIFAASAEELGFIRTSLIVLAYFVIAYRGFIIAHFAADKYTMLVATGITTWLTVQAFVNIAVNTGLMPVTGITLPFMSYGGTSMLTTLAGVGILLQISKSTTPYYASNTNRRRNGRSRSAKYGHLARG